jgi:chromosome segregation ATPase
MSEPILVPAALAKHWENEARHAWSENARLKAEVERLESDLKMEKENEDRLVRLWQTANNEVHGQRSQIAALIDNQTRLKAEVERLRKAGDLLAFHYVSLGRKFFPDDPLPSSVTDWNAAKEGKQS